MRQFPTRYAFDAGQNLPDKEFRYLRTIIVIADVHWRFGDWLAPLPLTFQHWSGVTPYTSPCGFAESCVFGKQSIGKLSLRPTSILAPFYSVKERWRVRNVVAKKFEVLKILKSLRFSSTIL